MLLGSPRTQLLKRASVVGSFLYGVLLVVVQLHFPFARFWLNFMASGQSNDMPMQAFESFILASQLPAAILLFRHPHFLQIVLKSRHFQLILILMGLLLISSWWSHLPGRSFWDGSIISLSVISCCYLAMTSTIRRFLVIVFTGLQVAISLTIWSVAREWPEAKQAGDGVWQGIFGNRNTLAPIAAVAALCGLAIALTPPKGWKGLIAIPALGAAVITDLFVLGQTHSTTNSLGFLFAFFVLFASGGISGFVKRGLLSVPSGERLLTSLILAVMTAVVAGMTLFADKISALFGRYSGLSGRFDFWKVSWAGIVDRPFFGWGWNAAWLSAAFEEHITPITQPFRWSHSVWLEFGLGIGFVGLCLGLAWMLWGLAIVCSSHIQLRTNSFLVAYPCFAGILLTMESMSWIFHWFFALLVAVYARVELDRLNQKSEREIL
jgi:O-antigen ligase